MWILCKCSETSVTKDPAKKAGEEGDAAAVSVIRLVHPAVLHVLYLCSTDLSYGAYRQLWGTLYLSVLYKDTQYCFLILLCMHGKKCGLVHHLPYYADYIRRHMVCIRVCNMGLCGRCVSV